MEEAHVVSPFAYADGHGSFLSRIASVGSSIPKPKKLLAMRSAQDMLQFVITVASGLLQKSPACAIRIA